MSDMYDNQELLPEDIEPERGIAKWAAFKHFAEINEILWKLTPLAWRVHKDPERENSFYIAGPPDTTVVAEGLTLDDASSIVELVNRLPEAVEHFDELAKLWDALSDSELSTYPEVYDYIETIKDYQIKIAQLENNPAVVPPAATAGELTFMHVGHLFSVFRENTATFPIASVTHVGDKVKVVVAGGDGSSKETYILNKDEPIFVVLNQDYGKIINIDGGNASPGGSPGIEVM